MADSKEFLVQLSRRLADEGKLIEAGWISFRAAAVDPRAPAHQLEEMRNTFFAGAQHLFGSIMSMLEDGVEETPGDLSRMTLINKELEKFLEVYKLKNFPTAGSA